MAVPGGTSISNQDWIGRTFETSMAWRMSKSFLSYVWSNSARWQIIILIMTGAYFPFLYLTLDLPKQIINDAIGGERFPVEVLGFQFDQLEYLLGLSLAYLFMVLA